MKLIVLLIISITMMGAEMRPDDNFETERDSIEIKSMQKHIEDENYDYYDYDYNTPTTTTAESLTNNGLKLLEKQPSPIKSTEETIDKERKIQDDDGGRRYARASIFNWPTRMLSRRKKSPPLPSNSKLHIVKSNTRYSD